VVDGHRLRPLADRGEAGPDPQAAQRPGRRQPGGADPGHRLIEHDDRDVVGVVLGLGVVGVGVPGPPVDGPSGRVIGGVEGDGDAAEVQVAVGGGEETVGAIRVPEQAA